MTHRYLPWVRRGLAASIDFEDSLDEQTPELATFTVGVRVNNDAPIDRDLRLHGPGDIVGIDPRGIIRTDPERYIADFEPNNLATIEFDHPDFPWLFTPAKARPDGRLRPWLVLVVVEDRRGVTLTVRGDAPLPVLHIQSPASPAKELPDLADSWAFAHAQVITENDDAAEIEQEVFEGHDLNLSRLICPRRLAGNRRYFACLVPAFEVGRLAGLGRDPVAGLGLTPAWQSGANAPPSIELPVYFHWEFGTSHGGSDFETLVDRLNPMELDQAAGVVPMFVGEAGDGVGAIDPAAAGAVLGLEGALLPISLTEPKLDDVDVQLRDDLKARLNLSSESLGNGTAPDAPPVGPPIYGAYHAGTHEVGTPGGPRWMDELNLDPRMRAVAALGASIVREHQEDLMDAAWAQVGDVLAANRILNEAALSRAVADKAFKKHVVPLRDDRLYALSAPAHQRTRSDKTSSESVKRAHHRSRMPDATVDAAFRRATSPQNRTIKRTARRTGAATGPGGSVDLNIAGGIEAGALVLEDLLTPADGVAPSKALAGLPVTSSTVDMTEVGGPPDMPGELIQTVKRELAYLPAGGSADAPLLVRDEVEQYGLVRRVHIDGMLDAVGERRGDLVANIASAVAALRPEEGATGIELTVGTDGITASMASEGPDQSGGDDPDKSGDDPVSVSGAPTKRLASPGSGTFGGAIVKGDDSGGIVPTGGDPGDITVLPLLDTDPERTRDFGRALKAFTAAFEPDLADEARPDLGLSQLRGQLQQANEPKAVAERRTASRIERDQQDGVEPFDPIMAVPEFPAPLHSVLAARGREHFLPGIGEIPPNAFVVVEPNTRFLEAFMVGINHEMNHELRWREYPTDRRGTPFRFFWDRLDGSPDINPIHTWSNTAGIGENTLGDLSDQIVLLIRAELLAHFPNTIIYAAPRVARWQPGPRSRRTPRADHGGAPGPRCDLRHVAGEERRPDRRSGLLHRVPGTADRAAIRS